MTQNIRDLGWMCLRETKEPVKCVKRKAEEQDYKFIIL